MSSSELSLETNDERVSYGLAMNMGASIARQGGVEIDMPAFFAGLQDGLMGKPSRVPTEALQAAFQAAQAKVDARAKEAAEEQVAAGREFLAHNKAKPGVVETASGLQYEVLTAGDGPKPSAEQTVEVHYHGTLIDGTVFDSSVSRGETVTFPVNGVIAGWVEALQLMNVGSKWRLVIPADLAYGDRAQGPIPAGSVLVFEVELVAVR